MYNIYAPKTITTRIRKKIWDHTFIKNNITEIKNSFKLNNDTISDTDATSFVLYVIENNLTMHRLKRYYNKCREFNIDRFIEFTKYKGSNNTSHYYFLLYGIYGEVERANMLTRRGSPWCPVNYAKKHNVSIEEATLHLKSTLKNKATNLSGFIARHGQVEGTQKFNEWVSKCKQTQDSFKERYGEESADRWDEYIQRKRDANPRCIEYWLIQGATVEQAKARVSEFQLNNAGVHIQYLLQNHDTETAHQILKQINLKKDAGSLKYFVSKYGDTPLACAKYRAACEMKDGVSVKSFMRRGFSREQAHELHKQAVLKRIPNSYSKESEIFFDQLLNMYSFTAEQIFRGEQERFLYDKVNQRFYLYDLTIITDHIKCIIEYHGTAFHPSPHLSLEKFESWRSPYSKETALEVSKRDREKKQLAIANGFEFCEIWSDDDQKLDKVTIFLNNILTHENYKSN